MQQHRIPARITSFVIAVLFILTCATLRAEEFSVLVQEEFNESMGGTVVAGSAQAEHIVGDVSYIALSERENNWDGLDILFEENFMEIDNDYRLTITVSVDEGVEVPEGSELWVQIPAGSYPLLQQASLVSGESLTISADFEWIDEEFGQFRIQTNEIGEQVPFNVLSYVIEQGAPVVSEAPVEEEPAGGSEEVTPTHEDVLTPEKVPTETPALLLSETWLDFEDGTTQGFEGRGGVELLEVIEGINHTEGGSYSLHTSQREAEWQGPALTITELVTVGQEYEMSAWIKTDSEEAITVQLSTQIGEGSSASYQNLSSVTLSAADDWVQVVGSYRYDTDGGGYIALYFESPLVEANFYIDDVSIRAYETPEVEVDVELMPIKELYAEHFLIGNAISSFELEGLMLDHLKHHHNLVTAENGMKPEALYDQDRNFNFAGADYLVDTALAEGFKVHGHVLVWHAQSPEWLWLDDEGEPLSREEALSNMETHIRTVMEHFGDKIMSWDVVNEALDGSFANPENWQSSLRESGWKTAIGDDFIYQAFRIAREVADDNGWDEMTLIYNDYNDDQQSKARTMYHMIKDINEQYREETGEDRPLISEVGMQAHYNLNTLPENVEASIELFRDLDIKIAVTELDVTTLTRNTYVQEELDRQALLYAKLFDIYKANSDIISRVTFWGINDAKSWRSDRYPLVFDGNLQTKSSYYAIIDTEAYLAEHDDQVEVIKAEAKANFGTPELGEAVDPMWDEQETISVSKYQSAWEGATAEARTLWDDEYLYVLMNVSDSVLDKSAEADHEQDSIEVFINETNEQELSYIEGTGQYRVNYDNEASFNPGSVDEGFVSFTTLSEDGYTVQIAIPWKTITPESGMVIGFDLQVNDAEGGSRIAVAAWNDQTGQGWQNPSVFGELQLAD